jgi:hypothetical protein
MHLKGMAQDVSDDVSNRVQPGETPAAAAEKKRNEKRISPAAERALAEATARRAERERIERDRPQELQGRGGLDPVRYGDWEVNGVASDF